MKEIKIKIPEEVVNAIQLKNSEVASMQAVVSNMIESHSLDTDTKVIGSPVFVGYQARLAKVRQEFEQAKDDMIATFVDEAIQATVMFWNLDYNSCTLTLQVRD